MMMRIIVGPPGVVAPSSPGSAIGCGETGSDGAGAGVARGTAAGAGALLLTELSMLIILPRLVRAVGVTARSAAYCATRSSR